MNLFDDLFNTLPKEEKKLSNAESYIQKRDAIQTTKDTEGPKSAIQPSKQFDEPVEPEIKPEDEDDQSTLLTMTNVIEEQVASGLVTPDKAIINYADRNEAYYQFRRSKPGEYVSFRDWMQMQKDPLAEAFIGVVKPDVSKTYTSSIEPKKDYRDSMPPGLKELQDMNGVNQPKQEEEEIFPMGDVLFNEIEKRFEEFCTPTDTGQPDLFEVTDEEAKEIIEILKDDEIELEPDEIKLPVKELIQLSTQGNLVVKKPIHLVIKGDPTAQKRHRSVNMGKFTRQYDPSAADKADFLSIVQANAPETPFNCPLRVDIDFYFVRPKSHFGVGKKEGILKDNAPLWHTSRNDVDNLAKKVYDALNKVFWRDDSLICETHLKKMYSEQPRTEITISVL